MWPLIAGMAKPITLSHQVRSGGWESMISANGGLPAHRYTPQVTQRWPRGSERASHITAIVAVNAQGQAKKPALLWNTKKIRGDMFLHAQCPATLKGTPGGWSSQEVLLEWVETVLVKETQPLSNPQKCILLLVDGSKTHLTLQGLQKMKSWGVEVVVFPPPSERCHPATGQSRFQGTEGLLSPRGRTLEKEKPSQSPVPCRLCATVDRLIC